MNIIFFMIMSASDEVIGRGYIFVVFVSDILQSDGAPTNFSAQSPASQVVTGANLTVSIKNRPHSSSSSGQLY